MLQEIMFTLPPFDVAEPTFADFREILKTNHLQIADDEPGLGFISFYYGGLYCGFSRGDHYFAHVILSWHDDIDFVNRSTFDAEFAKVRNSIIELCGTPIEEGQYLFQHRKADQHYLYSVWQLRHCRLSLLQDEYDIQFGLDLSLKFLYCDGDVQTQLYSENAT